MDIAHHQPGRAVAFADLVERAQGLVTGRRRAVLGITGAPAAGKTTLAEELVRALAPRPPDGLLVGAWVAHVPMDGFHLADVELDRLGLRDRKGAPETFDALGYAALLRRLREDTDEMIYAPGFERFSEQPIAGAIGVSRDARLIISEGNYLLVDQPRWTPIRPLCSEVWYVDLDPGERTRRLVERHIRFGKDERSALAWATGTDEQNAAVVADTRGGADVIVPAALTRRIGVPPRA